MIFIVNRSWVFLIQRTNIFASRLEQGAFCFFFIFNLFVQSAEICAIEEKYVYSALVHGVEARPLGGGLGSPLFGEGGCVRLKRNSMPRTKGP